MPPVKKKAQNRIELGIVDQFQLDSPNIVDKFTEICKTIPELLTEKRIANEKILQEIKKLEQLCKVLNTESSQMEYNGKHQETEYIPWSNKPDHEDQMANS